MAKKQKTYAELRAELDTVLATFDEENLDIDKALAQYERAIKLTKELETYLQNAENKIKKLR